MTDWIAIAEKHGAKFEPQPDGTVHAVRYIKGRHLALFTIIGTSQEDAARRYCQYIHVPGAGKLGEEPQQ